MFKKGDKLVCVDNQDGKHRLTIGNKYEVVNSSGMVYVINDQGNLEPFFPSRFKLAEEHKPFEFQVGDIVEFGGVEGIVTEVNKQYKYPVWVKFSESEGGTSFTLDGRYCTNHTKPLLNLVSRKEKRVVKSEVYYSPSMDCSYPLNSEKLPGDCITVELEKEIEVEV